MLATVLARQVDTPAGRVAQWRQLLDLLAQRRSSDDADRGRAALERLQAIRAEVPVDIRRETARAFAGRPVPVPLVAFLSADMPVVAGAILTHVRLREEEWLTLLPRLSPTGRGFLRHRRDLGPGVEAALASFGASDMALRGGVAGLVVPPAAPPTAPMAAPLDAPTQAAEPETESPAAPEPLLAVVPDPDPVEPESDALESDPIEPDPAPATPFEPDEGEGQIRAIISRIARFRTTPRTETELPRCTAFRFETGSDGTIRWVEGAPRGPLIGETIAVPADGSYGVDAQAPGAFRRRAPFRDSRFVVPGTSPVAGRWLIAGVPVFASVDGRFQGYRCVARRPEVEDVAEDPLRPRQPDQAPSLSDAGLQPDSLRQLVHELRTPLNAIGGFAEMIRRQMRGPVSTAYRDRAQAIVEQAGQLLAAVDDLDVAARLETQRLDLQRVEVDLASVTILICSQHAPAAQRRGATLDPAPSAFAPVMGDPAALRRMVGRLVASAAALADRGESIRVAVVEEGGQAQLRVTRPSRLAGLDDAQLLDPSYGPEGDWPDAPLLGLGFSLHLVRRLAAAAGGRLAIEADHFLLSLPAAGEAAHAGGDA